ncbi:nuclear pore complex protein Nup54 [Copidosoma floridanum]|uniref:nuclear pore complex protein Nup54 n=1 Tax=Copidosoma floridanum TaxID=29053 RepID=UPI0006C99360|nr:nuclear pore complex protein Nup54 [Copidosoma floridanum]
MSFGTGFGASTPAASSAFSFGAANPAVTATPIKPAGFGTTGTGFGFGNQATASNTSLFGTPAVQQAPAFGSTTFGAPAATGFGMTSGTVAATPATNFGFGMGTSTGFGATPAASSSFGLGSTVQPTSSTGGFGGFGGFGTTATTTSAPSLFSGFGTTNTQPAFGASTGGFGGFGAKPVTTSTSTGFGGFGTGSTFSGFGTGLTQPQQQLQQQQQQQQLQQQQQQQQQQSSNAISEALYNAVFNCQLFNDERDNTIARLNLIQALWGVGKAYYYATAPPIELIQENPLCRFKAIGYSRMPDADNNDGLVNFCFAKKEQELKDAKPQLIASLGQILGNKPNLTVTIDNIKSLGEAKGQVTIFVTEKSATGSLRKIPAGELFAYFSQAMQKQQLTQLGVENMFPQLKLDPAQLKEYMDNPPCSIDPRLWKQAQLDNPNPEHYIPVPMIGFQQVKHRLKCQEEETARHRAFLDLTAENIQSLKRQHTSTQARLKEHRRSLMELQHRVLQILVRQEITRKIGFSLQPEEEVLTNSFETMHSQISAPTQFKGRISEMLSQLRMRRHTDTQCQERYSMDPIAQDDIKTYLNMEQQGMAQLIDTVNTDLECLKIIKDGMSELLASAGSSAS